MKNSIFRPLGFALCLLSSTVAADPSSMVKQFKLSKEQIRPVATGYGGCLATDYIVVEGLPVRFMYREAPDAGRPDSGWRFMSGMESDDYMAKAENHGVYDVNTIANYDPSIIPFLDAPAGSAFEKVPGSKTFVRVTDWEPPKD